MRRRESESKRKSTTHTTIDATTNATTHSTPKHAPWLICGRGRLWISPLRIQKKRKKERRKKVLKGL